MKELVISIARTLLSKNIAFCIYRFPKENECRLAVATEYLPHTKEQSFWMTPFMPNSLSSATVLGVVKTAYMEDFLKEMQSAYKQKEINYSLSPATLQKEYFTQIKAFIKDIKAGKLKKAILSRVFYEDKPEDFDPLSCFLNLAENDPSAFTYLFLHPQSGLWLGASPELLLEKRGKNIKTIALAGTQFLKTNEHYQWREKELEEHKMVGQHIEAVFEENGYIMLNKKGPDTVETDSVAHLQTDYAFKAVHSTPFYQLLEDLHPTPAVAGLPVKASLDCIAAYEKYDRKYYCGMIGETDFSENADLYVNLRCMQVGKEKIAVYVGGGITAASNAQDEWEETVWKGQTMLKSIRFAKDLHTI